MSKFRNETGGVLTVSDLGILVGPGEKFDWPGHDPEVHGLPTGCTWLDAPKPKDGTAAGDDGKASGADDGEQHKASHGRAKGDGDQGKENAK